MYVKWGAVVVGLLFMCVGCGQDASDEDTPEFDTEQTGLAVAVEVPQKEELAGFQFTIRECGDGEAVLEQTVGLEELLIPGEIPEMNDAPFDSDSGHRFADFFQVIDAGCYDMEAEPIDGSDQSLVGCGAATASDVYVVGGQTTEIMLISQCEGRDVGALDAVGAVNHPPVIESIDYEPSKFVHECEAVDICVTAYDPNGDPMEFEFEQIAGQQLRFDLEITDVERDGKRATSCMRAVPVWNDDYGFRVSVYDLGWKEGQQVRLEDVIGETSRAEMDFPMYSNWDIELECYDPDTELFYPFEGVREVERVEGCIPIWPEQFYCSEMHWDETDRTCPDGEFDPEEVYPICGEIEAPIQDEGRGSPRFRGSQ